MLFIPSIFFALIVSTSLITLELISLLTSVPKGSIGLTEQFANIYTFESPGGWNIIGNTPLNVFDIAKEKEPNLINPGIIFFVHLKEFQVFYTYPKSLDLFRLNF